MDQADTFSDRLALLALKLLVAIKMGAFLTVLATAMLAASRLQAKAAPAPGTAFMSGPQLEGIAARSELTRRAVQAG